MPVFMFLLEEVPPFFLVTTRFPLISSSFSSRLGLLVFLEVT